MTNTYDEERSEAIGKLTFLLGAAVVVPSVIAATIAVITVLVQIFFA